MEVWYSNRARQKRAALFRELLHPTPSDRILDLGSEDGSHIAKVIDWRENVTIADIDSSALERGRDIFGFDTLAIGETGPIPVHDGAFDIVFCSSVIEHATGPKDRVLTITNGSEFVEVARRHQVALAREIDRVGRRYFVQTPYRYFPIESHTWLPIFVAMLPRRFLIPTIAFFNLWWPKKTEADWRLLTAHDLQELFPTATIVRERSLGFTKSLIAVKTDDENGSEHVTRL